METLRILNWRLFILVLGIFALTGGIMYVGTPDFGCSARSRAAWKSRARQMVSSLPSEPDLAAIKVAPEMHGAETTETNITRSIKVVRANVELDRLVTLSEPDEVVATRGLSAAESEQLGNAQQIVFTPHVDLLHEEPVSPLEDFDVIVYTGADLPHSSEHGEPVHVPAVESESDFSVNVALLTSASLTVIDESLKKLTIKRDEKKSAPVVFKVRATDARAHSGRITAYFSYRGRPVGSVTRTIAISSPTSLPNAPEAPQSTNEGPQQSGDKALKLDGGAKQPDWPMKMDRSSPVVSKMRATDAMAHGGVVIASFSYQRGPIGSVTRAIAAVSDPSPPPNAPEAPQSTNEKPKQSGDKLKLDNGAKEPDLTVEIFDEDNDNQHLRVVVRTPWLDGYPQEGRWPLRAATPQLVNEYMTSFVNEKEADKRLVDLRAAGIHLFWDTPKVFQNAFWKLLDSGKPFQTISIVSQEPFFPWELVVPERPEREEEEAKPLGVRFAVGRWISREYGSTTQSFSMRNCRTIAPDYRPKKQKLQQTASEAQFICDNFNAKPIDPANWHNLNDSLTAAPADMLHFACHGSSPGLLTQTQYLTLEKDEELTSLQVSGITGFQTCFRKGKPFVFLNACEVGRQTISLSGPGGFVASFIRLGASAIVAPLWSVKDTVARDVAVEFYTKIKANPDQSFASILRDIRAKAYDGPTKGEDTYAAYCFYGDPLAGWINNTTPLGGIPLPETPK